MSDSVSSLKTSEKAYPVNVSAALKTPENGNDAYLELEYDEEILKRAHLFEGAVCVATTLLEESTDSESCAICLRKFKNNNHKEDACVELAAQLQNVIARKEEADAAVQNILDALSYLGMILGSNCIKTGYQETKRGTTLYLRQLKTKCLENHSCAACNIQLDHVTSVERMLANVDRLSSKMYSRSY